ncbi:MAG: translocation/assembly module TamB domain-containing protein [Devosia sp.]
MRRVFVPSLIAAGLLAAPLALPLIAQDQMSPEEQRDWFVQFVEGQLSTPERQIRISNIEGILSEEATIRQITISDGEGVWLTIVNAAINWDRGALFGGRLQVRSLSAERIDYARNPVATPSPTPALPSPEAGGFEVPEFPVAIILEELSVPSVRFGEQVFGLGSELSVTGALRLEGGSLDTDLAIQRLDGPGGSLTLDVSYANADQQVDLALSLVEPPNGILANLLSIEGRPEIALGVTGAGPLDALSAQLTLDAGGTRALAGTARISGVAEGLQINADLGGPLAQLVAPAYREFFGAETSLSAEAMVRSAGEVDVSRFSLSGGQLGLSGAGRTSADGFLRQLSLEGRILNPGGGTVLLPVPGATTRVGRADLTVDFGRAGSEDWTAAVTVDGFANGTLAAERLTLAASGVAAGLDDPATRRITFNGDGALAGISASDAEISAALGQSAALGFAGQWSAGEPLQLAQFRLVAQALELAVSGAVADAVFDGTVTVDGQVAPFSELAGRDLGGALSLAAEGTIAPLTGGFDLALQGQTTDLVVDDEIADRQLAGQASVTGRLARTESGFSATGFRIGNERVELTADGRFATGAADFRFAGRLSDLGLVSPDASGAVTVSGTARGEGTIALSLVGEAPTGRLAGRSLAGGRFAFGGAISPEGVVTGTLDGGATLEGQRVALVGDVAVEGAVRRIEGLSFTAGGAALTGGVVQDEAGLLTGQLRLAAPDISTAAALFLQRASGSANADISLSPVDGRQSATVSGSVRSLSLMDTRLAAAEISAEIDDLFGVPAINGTATGSGLVAGGVEASRFSVMARRAGASTGFEGQADLATGASVSAAGSLSPIGEAGYRLALERASLVQGGLTARLAQPTAFAIDDGRVSLDRVQLDVGGGRLVATGTAGEALDIAVSLEALPLSAANAIQPGLGLAGTVSGSGRITGSASDPQASFSLAGTGIGATAIEPFGIAPLRFTAQGNFADNALRIASAEASGAGGLALTGSGTVPLSGRRLDIRAPGSAPLALGNRFVADRGGQLSGVARLEARVTGSLSDPQATGTVSTSGAGYVDPELNLRLVDIAGSATLSGDRAEIGTLTARLATGGSIAASGSVGISAGNPADIRVSLNQARYADGDLFVATLSGDLRVSGQLMRNPLVSGQVFVERADVTVPETFGGSTSLIDVTHRAPPPPVAATLRRAMIDAGGAPIPQTRPSVVQLDITVSAPNQIFVRGRGLDAELGGSVRLTGPVMDIRPVGGFELIRGRLSMLGQRITLQEGSLTLVGTLDPSLNLVARTEGEGIVVFVTVSGRLSDLSVDFSSSPALPQDEVLARLLFNRSMGELSPLQVARLAGAAAELAGGGGGNSIVDSLRERAGLDDLDVVTDEEGNVAVQAGRYIQDNIYLGVTAGADGNSRVNVNLDITDDIRARASTGLDGDSSIGIFYEADY